MAKPSMELHIPVSRLILSALMAGVFCWAPSPSGAQARGAQAPPLKVPLAVGLVTVGAVHEPDKGDYESILTINQVSAGSVGYVLSANVDDRRVTVTRVVTREDMAHAHEWRPRYNSGDPQSFPGSTGATLSADVLNELKVKGKTALKASIAADPLGSLLKGILGGNAGALGNITGKSGSGAAVEGTLSRVGAQPVNVSVLVNDSRVDLPAVHARGQFGAETFEVYILDDPAFPLVLRWSLGETGKRIVSISYPTASASSHIEDKLIRTGRAEVYGIYFDFAKATIRPESESVLTEIASIMARNSEWKLSVEGHTDSIGGAASNQDLSTRRAAAVRQALVDRYRVAPGRLTPAGFGASRPRETNDTLEGRARNRRVELVRQTSASQELGK